jgi:hypothetical protein
MRFAIMMRVSEGDAPIAEPMAVEPEQPRA